ncbi:unnamed protein product [Euphydryas editha]|uniref:Uncharacterized protein n=1 Tax=Euphydryas editha TaxID=104508 RepID=A0AAU9TD28_EUPED|nr:unnamed protein product [Euphydryas editha]
MNKDGPGFKFLKQKFPALSDAKLKEDSSSNRNINMQNLRKQGGNAQREAFETREIFKRFFNSAEGSVPWQENVIHK